MMQSLLPHGPHRAAAAAASTPTRARRRPAQSTKTTTAAAAAHNPSTTDNLVTCLLVGAGPGPLDLLTLRAADALRRADAVLYDDLGPSAEAARALAPPSAALVPVGKRGTDGATGGAKQQGINRELVERCAALRSEAERDGRPRVVVRLKGGCPSVFSRAGSEMEALRSAGFSFEFVPGVSSALAAPLLAGFPLTEGPRPAASGSSSSEASERQRRQAGFVVLSGHGAASDARWGSAAGGVAAAVVLMGGKALPAVVERLKDNAGFSDDTPVAVIRDAGGGGQEDDEKARPQQRVWRAPLSAIVDATKGEDLSPCVVVVGDCTRL